MVYNEAKKEAQYRWVAKNPEKWRAQARKNTKNWYEKNKECKCAYAKQYYQTKKLERQQALVQASA